MAEPSEFDWQGAASRLLKSEMALAGVTSRQLAARLTRLGLEETEASVKNKIYRGSFSLAFMLACLQALGREKLEVGVLLPKAMPAGVDLDGD